MAGGVDARLAEVVEDERGLRCRGHRLRAGAQLVDPDHQVDGEASGAGGGDAPADIGAGEVVRVGDGLHLVADADQPPPIGAGPKLGDGRLEVGIGEADPAHHPEDLRGRVRDREEAAGLGEVAAARLDQDGSRYAGRPDLLAQVLDGVVASDRCQAGFGKPGVLGGPQVLMSVDDHAPPPFLPDLG